MDARNEVSAADSWDSDLDVLIVEESTLPRYTALKRSSFDPSHCLG